MQRQWTKRELATRAKHRALAEQVFPYLKLPCFADPFTQFVNVHSDGTSYGVPDEERIRECCAAILAHAPRPPVHSGLVEVEMVMVSPSPRGKSNSPWPVSHA